MPNQRYAMVSFKIEITVLVIKVEKKLFKNNKLHDIRII